jgi:hypothetical protein
VVAVTTVVEVLAVIFAVWVAIFAAVLWWLARRNRVAPAAHTGAPLHWLAAPSRAATAHRRLRRAVAAARAGLGAAPTDGPAQAELARCVATLERQAVDLDHRVVVAARCPPATRWKLVGELEPQIRDVERLGGQLAAIAVLAPTRPVPSAEGLEALDDRLAALAAARAELDAIEADGRTPLTGPSGPSDAAGARNGGDRALPAAPIAGVGFPSHTPVTEARRRTRR